MFSRKNSKKTHHVVDFLIANPKTATKNTPTGVDVLESRSIIIAFYCKIFGKYFTLFCTIFMAVLLNILLIFCNHFSQKTAIRGAFF